MTYQVLQMGFDEWLDINAWFISEINSVLDCFYLKIR